MAVATRKSPTRARKSTSHRPVPLRNRYPEAPDRGERDREAPEVRREGPHAEAPDAGFGRMSGFDPEFTHGRSQS